MDRILMLMSVQGAMGAFDLVYHHELTERLAWRTGSGDRAAARLRPRAHQ